MEEIGGKRAFPLENLIAYEIAPILASRQFTCMHIASQTNISLYFTKFEIFAYHVLLMQGKYTIFFLMHCKSVIFMHIFNIVKKIYALCFIQKISQYIQLTMMLNKFYFCLSQISVF